MVRARSCLAGFCGGGERPLIGPLVRAGTHLPSLAGQCQDLRELEQASAVFCSSSVPGIWPKQRISPAINLLSTQLQVNCNCLPSHSRHIENPLNMFRNALRQSTRAVGAISATSRVAAVSLPLPDETTRRHHHHPQTVFHPADPTSIPPKAASSPPQLLDPGCAELN